MEVDAFPIHPNPHPNPHHRKIELQSPLDLSYLQSNLSQSARQKLDLHFPPTAYHPPAPPAKPAEFISLDGPNKDASTSSISPTLHPQAHQEQTQPQEEEEDPLRARVRQLVEDFLARTWSGASHSISINGLDAHTLAPSPPPPTTHPHSHPHLPTSEHEGVHFTYSPYDSQLQTRVAHLYAELETLTAQVSKLRREAPQQGAMNYSVALMEEIAVDERDWEDERVKMLERKEGGQNGMELQPLRDGWYEDVREMYGRGVDEVVRLAGLGGDDRQKGGSLTETVGRVQRARTVAMEFD